LKVLVEIQVVALEWLGDEDNGSGGRLFANMSDATESSFGKGV